MPTTITGSGNSEDDLGVGKTQLARFKLHMSGYREATMNVRFAPRTDISSVVFVPGKYKRVLRPTHRSTISVYRALNINAILAKSSVLSPKYHDLTLKLNF